MTEDNETPTLTEETEIQSESGTVQRSRRKKVIPPRPKRRSPGKYKFIAGLLAVVIPGTGHLYLGLLRKGISLFFIILLDIAALLYFSSIGMQINVPLLILLALFIPVVYFYNVFDVLQASDRMLQHRNRIGMEEQPDVFNLEASFPAASPVSAESEITRRPSFVSEPGISFGLLLFFGGILLILFRQRPLWLRAYIEDYSGATISLVLICGGMFLGIREIVQSLGRHRGQGNRRKRRIGRYTASLLLACVGALLLLDWRGDTEYMLQLLKWWPAVPVLWGLEYLLMYFFARREGTGYSAGNRFKLDLRGLLSAMVLAASVFIVAEQEHYLHLWNKVNLNLSAAAVDYSEASGSKFQKQPLIVPVELDSVKITIDAINGDILLHRAPVEDIEIVTTVWVDQLKGVMAEAISEQSFVDVEEGPNIKITPKGRAYGDSGKRQPRLNMDIVLPEDRRFNLEIRTMNGAITLQNVEAIENISLETGNGQLILHRIFGNVTGKTLNGEVRARSVQGSVELSTSGGAMNAWDVTGALKLSTAVGDIGVFNNGDSVDISSKNGNLTVTEARSKLRAESLNGSIDVRSTHIGGDWDIYSAVGDLYLHLPVDGDYTLEGSSGYGDIVSELPWLIIDKKTISGEVGTGEFKLHAEGNSNLNVRKY